MILGRLTIGDPHWWLPAGLMLAAALGIVWWAYRRVKTATAVRTAAVLLKTFGLVLLAVCLVHPLWSGMRARPGANLFLLLADNSRSLTIQDAADDQQRGVVLKDLLAEEASGWQSRLGQDFEVRRYAFDSRLRRVGEFSELTFDGNVTALHTALKTLHDRFQNRPVAGMLLFTDGNATDIRPGEAGPLGTGNADGLPPIYPVILGGKSRIRDVAVQSVSVRQTSFEDAPVTVRADVSTAGYPDATIHARVHNEAGEVVAEKTQTVAGDGAPLKFRFQLRPAQPGVTFYRLQVTADEADPGSASASGLTEAATANNTRLMAVGRGHGPFRVLYVSGRPNWEFKFLNRAVEEDPQIELAALIRIAKQEPKFDFRGRVGESSNPLFRGFQKESDEDTERYDEPVFVRLNMQDDSELRGGFPTTAEELYPFHAVVLDDVEAEFFTHDQMTLLESFVSERGGGLLMLGGQESYRRGGYQGNPVGAMLPVYLDRTPRSDSHARYRLSLTREGWLQPWVRLRSTWATERNRLEEMPAFHTLNRVGAVKPGAAVLATATGPPSPPYERGEQRGRPALVVQRYGRGRSAAITIGDLWRWQLHRVDEKEDLQKAWRQMMRWLVSDVPDRIEPQLRPAPEISAEAVRLQAHVRNAQYRPLENASVTFTVRPLAEDNQRGGQGERARRRPGEESEGAEVHIPLSPSPRVPLSRGAAHGLQPAPSPPPPSQGGAISLDAEPSSEEAGVYEAIYVPREVGAYRWQVRAVDAEGNEIGTARSGWTSDPAAAEYRSMTPDRPLLQQLARRTGGETVAIERLDDFVASLPTRNVPITEAWTYPLWHQSWLFVIALGCFIAEWGLRRWKGLP